MPEGSPRGPNIRDLESLRIDRPAAALPQRRLLPAIVIAVAIVAAGAAGYFAYARTLGRPPEVRTAIASVRSADQPGVVLTGSGYVVTQHKYIIVGTKILGQIVEEPIEEGQHVHKGDLLARIDDRDYQAQLRQAIADRDLALANVRLKQAQAVRLRTLFGDQVASQDQLDVAENALAVAEADFKRAQGAIDYARFNVGQCRIVSPIDGIVLQKYRELGDTINYGGEVQAGGGATDIVQLADTTDMRTEVDINESDIAKVTMGQPVAVIPDAYPDKSFAAVVAKIYPEADRQKGTVKVEVKLRDPDLSIIRPEMSAKVTFLAGDARLQAAPLVTVPKKAIVSDGMGKAVWVVRGSEAHRVTITTGRELQDGVEIHSGLEGGEQVILEPPANLQNGSRVTAAGS
ncbi:MAG TPA: efflux RND transporter periplasmic adaptor subunit [Candidatus Binataceae bacterium]|nr:efflux RND transporter periplasmic adaptor subunit [Candidatus Binataceae bacterium]